VRTGGAVGGGWWTTVDGEKEEVDESLEKHEYREGGKRERKVGVNLQNYP